MPHFGIGDAISGILIGYEPADDFQHGSLDGLDIQEFSILFYFVLIVFEKTLTA